MGRRKKIMILILTILILLTGIMKINAKTVNYRDKSYDVADSGEALYCGYQERFYSSKGSVLISITELMGNDYTFEGCIRVVKPGTKHSTGVVTFLTNYGLDYHQEEPADLLVYTTEDDLVYKDTTKDNWWSTLRYCYSLSTTGFSHSLNTDYFSSTSSEYDGIFNFGKCLTLTNESTDKELLIETCPTISDLYYEIKKSVSDYQSSNDNKYLTRYKKKVEETRSLCTQTMKYADYSDGCMNLCINMEKDIYELNKTLGISEKSSCGFSTKLIAWILNILKWIKYIVPVVVIILGSLDFIKATASEKNDDVKKAQSNFVKRLIAAALIFLIPLIIEFVLPKFGFDYNSCDLF